MILGRARVAAAALLATLALAATASAKPGDVFVADEGEGLFKLGPKGGSATLFELPDFSDPSGMTLDTKGKLFIADYGTDGKIYRATRKGGASVFLEAPAVVEPTDVALGPDGMLYVADGAAGEGGGAAILRVNPRTKAVTTWVGDGPSNWNYTGGIAVARDLTVYVTDYDDEVFRVDPKTKAVTEFADDPSLDGADGLLLTPDERFLFVASWNTDPVNLLNRVDLRNGEVDDFAPFHDIVAVSRFPNGDFLASDTDDSEGFEGLRRLGRKGSPLTTFSGDSDFDYPHDAVIEPKKCKGKWPTVVGTDRKEKIKGSKFDDVISALGGNDKVNAGKGNDIVCAGKGNDKVNGAKGKDVLKGQKGRDKLNGGPGKDKEID